MTRRIMTNPSSCFSVWGGRSIFWELRHIRAEARRGREAGLPEHGEGALSAASKSWSESLSKTQP